MENQEPLVLPLRECSLCRHKNVCEFIDTLINIEAPIDIFNNACGNFATDSDMDSWSTHLTDTQLSESMIEGDIVDEDDEELTDIQIRAVDLLNDIEDEVIFLTETGVDVNSLQLSANDLELLKHAFAGYSEEDMKYMQVRELYLHNDRKISVSVNPDLQDGQYEWL